MMQITSPVYLHKKFRWTHVSFTAAANSFLIAMTVAMSYETCQSFIPMTKQIRKLRCLLYPGKQETSHPSWTRETQIRNYPCLCLCFGFSQIILMEPLRRMILHLSQIGFTDALTFIDYLLLSKTLKFMITHLHIKCKHEINKYFYLSLQIILPFVRS